MRFGGNYHKHKGGGEKMNRVSVCILIVFALGISSCATAPENIAPSYVSEMSYNSWTCEQLAQEQPRLVAALARAYDAQTKARSNDIAGVILLGLPVSTLSGSNMAGEVARLKGELDALQRTAILKNCFIPPVPPLESFRAKPEQQEDSSFPHQ
jgi:hypothetical protein